MDKNIIACLSPGRSGTELLTRLLALAENALSVHEPDPTYQHVTESIRANADETETFVRDIKLPAIQATQTPNYIETSHLFGKGPFEAFIKLKVPFRLIILNRDPRDVAKSHWRIKAIPARSDKKQQFLLHPDLPGVLQLPNWKKMSDYQLCLWYALEVERRKPIYAEQCRQNGLCVAEVSLKDLLDFDRFSALIDTLGLSLPDDAQAAHKDITSTKVNAKSKYRSRMSLVPLDKQETQLWDALGVPGADLRKAVADRYEWSTDTA